jgi:hypothetical protein
MKVLVKCEIDCNYENLKKYIPARYVSLVSQSYYGETVNFVCFPIDKHSITSKEILKAQKKIATPEMKTFYFAHNFTLEASEAIGDSNGIAFYEQDYPWTDEKVKHYRNDIS